MTKKQRQDLLLKTATELYKGFLIGRNGYSFNYDITTFLKEADTAIRMVYEEDKND